MTIASYVRVSSASQSAAMQQHAIQQAARARGHVVSTWYREVKTGARLDRPELARLRQDAREGRIQTLYVYRLDRLTRTGVRDTLVILEELRGNGCAVLSVADGFDLSGPAAEVVTAVLAWAAKMERLAITERIQSARARIEATGGAWGRPHRMTPVERARCRELSAEGKSARQIAMQMRVPRSTVRRALAEAPGLRKCLPGAPEPPPASGE